MRGKRLCVLHHTNILSERGWARFLREWDKNLMGKRYGTSFSVMTDGIMQRFLDHLGYEVIEKSTHVYPARLRLDCPRASRRPAEYHRLRDSRGRSHGEARPVQAGASSA